MRNDREHKEQKTVIQWAVISEGVFPELAMLFAIPNGGQRNVIVAAKLKAEGVKRGYPDLGLDVARGCYHGLRIEMKAPDGDTKPEQRDWLRNLTTQGYFATTAWGADEAVNIIKMYLRLERGQSMPSAYGPVHARADRQKGQNFS
jgi:VRR-NUC domain